MNQDYAEGFDRAFQFAGTALAYLKKKNIAANPQNLVLWNEYFLGAQLQAQVQASGDQVMKLNQELTEVRADALSDGLTGIANRRCFYITLADAMIQSAEANSPLALVLTDLDHFTKFNDTYDHPVGDQVPQVVARTLTKLTKGRDLAARYGREEFAIILPETDLNGPVTVAEHFSLKVSTKKLKRKGSDTAIDPLTLSLGVTTYNARETASSFIDRAVQALYQSQTRRAKPCGCR